MTVDPFSVIAIIGYILIFFGLVGAVVPVLPGPPFIWLGIFIWAWADGFARIGWPMLVLFGVLTLIAWGADLMLTTLSSRRSGVSWRAIALSILGGIVGAILLSFIPILGTLIGAIVGSASTLWYMEYRDKGDKEAATRAVRAYFVGYLLAMIIGVSISLAMIAIFIWQAFL
jgi:uncharacterized protein